MLNQLSEIAPAGALLAAVAWGGISYFVTGPEMAQRIAHAEYLPVCEEQVSQAVSRSAQGALNQANQLSEIEHKAQAARDYVDMLRRQYGDEGIDGIDIFLGGAISQAMQRAENLERQAREARKQARQMVEARRDAAISAAPDQCACQITAALNETKTDWALFAGSLTLIENGGIDSFPSLMRANSRMCSERIQS